MNFKNMHTDTHNTATTIIHRDCIQTNAPHYKLVFTMVCHDKNFQDEFTQECAITTCTHLHTDHDRNVHAIPILACLLIICNSKLITEIQQA